MPTYATPDPIGIRVDLPVGDIRIIASDRDTTTVTVLGDEDAIRVEFVDGQVTVISPATGAARGGLLGWGLGLLGLGPDLELSVTAEVPGGSRLHATTRYGSISTEGRLGDCRVGTDYGDVQLGETGTVEIRVRHGEIGVDHVGGDADIVTSSGDVRVGVIEGSASITDKHSDVAVAEAMGPLQLRGAHGELSVGRVLDGVVARNAYGGVRVDELVAGACEVATTYGGIEIGIADGTAAWLDLGSDTGTVRNQLDEQSGPDAFDRTAEIHARTSHADITVRRARARAGARSGRFRRT